MHFIELRSMNCHDSLGVSRMNRSFAYGSPDVRREKKHTRWPWIILNWPASEGYAENLSQRPAVASRHVVRQKVFHFAGEDVTSHNQRAVIAHQFLRVSLPPAPCPTNFPHFTAAMSVLGVILLRRLFAKRGRVGSQVLNFARLPFACSQPRVLLSTARLVIWRCF